MKTYSIIFFFLCLSVNSNAQETIVQKDNASLDPSITHGQFPNGFQYYIKPVKNKSMEIRFIVKAGFNQEDADQYTLAHFMEHIALKAGKNSAVNLLYGSELSRELGMSPGSVNAYTAGDFTEYIMRIPKTDKEEKALVFVFQLIKDMMSNLEFKDRYIDSERDPFFDESEVRGGKTSLLSKVFSLDSRIMNCGGREPKDFLRYVENFPKRKLVRFYKDWYRPDLMGIIITGDVQDGLAMKSKLKKWFSRVPSPKNPRPRINCKKRYSNAPPRFVKQERPIIYKDRYVTELFYHLYFKEQKQENQSDKERLEKKLKKKILFSILRERFNLLKKVKEWPFMVVVPFTYDFPLGLKLRLHVPENDSKYALTSTIKALKQFREQGIVTIEFQNAKNQMLQSLKGQNPESKRYWIEEIRKHFVQGEALPKEKNKLLLKLVDSFTKKDIEAFFKESFATLPEDIGLIAPAKHQAFQLREKTVRSWLAQAQKQEVSTFKMPKLPKQLIDSLSLSELQEKKYKEVTSTVPNGKQYILANGLQVILNSFKPGKGFFLDQDIIKFTGISQKGASCFPEESYSSAINAPEIIAYAGIGSFKQWELKKFLKTKKGRIAAYPYINYRESGIRGKASIGQLETALQLVYLYFTQSKKDSVSYKRWKHNTPDRYLQDVNGDDLRTKIEAYLNHADYLPLGTKRMKGVKQTDLDLAHAIYQNIFGKAKDFTFLFSGNFDEEKVLQLCNKYLGNLPNVHTALKCEIVQDKTQPKIEPNRSIDWESNEVMTNSMVRLIYRTKTEGKYNWKERTKLSLLARLMNVTLMKELREESNQGGPYLISVFFQYDRINKYKGLTIKYNCNPKDCNRLASELQEVIKKIKKKPFGKNIFQTVITEFMPGKKLSNSKMLKKMANHYRYQQKWYTQEELRNYIASLTPKDIYQVAIDNLKEEPIQFTLVSKNENREANEFKANRK